MKIEIETKHEMGARLEYLGEEGTVVGMVVEVTRDGEALLYYHVEVEPDTPPEEWSEEDVTPLA